MDTNKVVDQEPISIQMNKKPLSGSSKTDNGQKPSTVKQDQINILKNPVQPLSQKVDPKMAETEKLKEDGETFEEKFSTKPEKMLQIKKVSTVKENSMKTAGKPKLLPLSTNRTDKIKLEGQKIIIPKTTDKTELMKDVYKTELNQNVTCKTELTKPKQDKKLASNIKSNPANTKLVNEVKIPSKITGKKEFIKLDETKETPSNIKDRTIIKLKDEKILSSKTRHDSRRLLSNITDNPKLNKISHSFSNITEPVKTEKEQKSMSQSMKQEEHKKCLINTKESIETIKMENGKKEISEIKKTQKLMKSTPDAIEKCYSHNIDKQKHNLTTTKKIEGQKINAPSRKDNSEQIKIADQKKILFSKQDKVKLPLKKEDKTKIRIEDTDQNSQLPLLKDTYMKQSNKKDKLGIANLEKQKESLSLDKENVQFENIENDERIQFKNNFDKLEITSLKDTKIFPAGKDEKIVQVEIDSRIYSTIADQPDFVIQKTSLLNKEGYENVINAKSPQESESNLTLGIEDIERATNFENCPRHDSHLNSQSQLLVIDNEQKLDLYTKEESLKVQVVDVKLQHKNMTNKQEFMNTDGEEKKVTSLEDDLRSTSISKDQLQLNIFDEKAQPENIKDNSYETDEQDKKHLSSDQQSKSNINNEENITNRQEFINVNVTISKNNDTTKEINFENKLEWQHSSLKEDLHQNKVGDKKIQYEKPIDMLDMIELKGQKELDMEKEDKEELTDKHSHAKDVSNNQEFNNSIEGKEIISLSENAVTKLQELNKLEDKKIQPDKSKLTVLEHHKIQSENTRDYPELTTGQIKEQKLITLVSSNTINDVQTNRNNFYRKRSDTITPSKFEMPNNEQDNNSSESSINNSSKDIDSLQNSTSDDVPTLGKLGSIPVCPRPRAIFTNIKSMTKTPDKLIYLEEPVSIGRQKGSSISTFSNGVFDSAVMSRDHAQISYHDGKFFLEDMDSSNGTFVNDHMIPSCQLYQIYNEDIVQFGTLVITGTKTFRPIIIKLELILPLGIPAEKRPEEPNEHTKIKNELVGKIKDLEELLKEKSTQTWNLNITQDELIAKIESLKATLIELERMNHQQEKKTGRNKLQGKSKQLWKKSLQGVGKLIKGDSDPDLYKTETESEPESIEIISVGHTGTLKSILKKRSSAEERKKICRIDSIPEIYEIENCLIQKMEEEKQAQENLMDQISTERKAKRRSWAIRNEEVNKQLIQTENQMPIVTQTKVGTKKMRNFVKIKKQNDPQDIRDVISKISQSENYTVVSNIKNSEELISPSPSPEVENGPSYFQLKFKKIYEEVDSQKINSFEEVDLKCFNAKGGLNEKNVNKTKEQVDVQVNLREAQNGTDTNTVFYSKDMATDNSNMMTNASQTEYANMMPNPLPTENTNMMTKPSYTENANKMPMALQTEDNDRMQNSSLTENAKKMPIALQTENIDRMQNSSLTENEKKMPIALWTENNGRKQNSSLTENANMIPNALQIKNTDVMQNAPLTLNANMMQNAWLTDNTNISGVMTNEGNNISGKSIVKPNEESNIRDKTDMVPFDKSNISDKDDLVPNDKNNIWDMPGLVPNDKNNVWDKSGKNNILDKPGEVPNVENNVLDKSGMILIDKNNTTDRSVEVPNEKNDIQEKSGVVPNETNNIRDKCNMEPNKENNIRNETAVVPIEKKKISNKSVVIPDKSGVVPIEKKNIAAKTGVLPIAKNSILDKSDMAPNEKNNVPDISGVVAIEKNNILDKSSLMPIENIIPLKVNELSKNNSHGELLTDKPKVKERSEMKVNDVANIQVYCLMAIIAVLLAYIFFNSK